MHSCVYTCTHDVTLLAMSMMMIASTSLIVFFTIMLQSEEVVKLLRCSHCLSVCLPQILITWTPLGRDRKDDRERLQKERSTQATNAKGYNFTSVELMIRKRNASRQSRPGSGIIIVIILGNSIFPHFQTTPISQREGGST